MSDYPSEAVTARLSTESTRGVHPTSGWWTAQVDVGGISGFEPAFQDVERDIHSVNATMESGDHVAYTVAPQLVHDCNKEFLDGVAGPVYRANAAHLGPNGVSLFRPTAVVDGGGGNDSFTVAASGDIGNNMLIYTRGFTNSGNNGLFVTAGTPTTTAIKVATGLLTAEASPPANATLDLVGIQGTANDIGITAAGHLTSAGGVDFTTKNLRVGEWIYLPTPAEATAMGDALYAFSTAVAPSGATLGTNCGFARITAIAAAQLTLERHTFTIAADLGTGAGEIIRIFMPSRFYRNWPLDDTTNYDAETLSLEKEDVKPGVGADTRYTYAHGCGANTLAINSPLNNKLTATLSLVGMTATDPLASGSRKSGPSTAYAPQTQTAGATALVDAQNDLKSVRIGDSGGSLLSEFNEWTYTHGNNVTPKGVQCRFGAGDLNFGKFNDLTNFTGYHSDPDVLTAVTENRAVWWDAAVRNHQFGFLLDMPNGRIRNRQLTYAGNQPVMISGDVMGSRSPTDGIQASLCVFGYLPSA